MDEDGLIVFIGVGIVWFLPFVKKLSACHRNHRRNLAAPVARFLAKEQVNWCDNPKFVHGRKLASKVSG